METSGKFLSQGMCRWSFSFKSVFTMEPGATVLGAGWNLTNGFEVEVRHSIRSTRLTA